MSLFIFTYIYKIFYISKLFITTIKNFRTIQIGPLLLQLSVTIFGSFTIRFFNPYDFTKLLPVLDLFGQSVNDFVCQTFVVETLNQEMANIKLILPFVFLHIYRSVNMNVGYLLTFTRRAMSINCVWTHKQ